MLIVVAGWLSPELYLRRPPAKNEQYRLDRMLQAAAQRGVRVNIVVYKEVEGALTCTSSNTIMIIDMMDLTSCSELRTYKAHTRSPSSQYRRLPSPGPYSRCRRHQEFSDSLVPELDPGCRRSQQATWRITQGALR